MNKRIAHLASRRLELVHQIEEQRMDVAEDFQPLAKTICRSRHRTENIASHLPASRIGRRRRNRVTGMAPQGHFRFGREWMALALPVSLGHLPRIEIPCRSQPLFKSRTRLNKGLSCLASC